MSQEKKLDIGDIVKIKSGGPKSTIIDTDSYGSEFKILWITKDGQEHKIWVHSRSVKKVGK